MSSPDFDYKTIHWDTIDGIDHLSYFLYNVDRDGCSVDVLLKFTANEKILLHRHVALNHMLVLQGEHRLYEPDGSIKEIRPTGRYTVSPPSNDPHMEGGGDEDVIILFSIRGTDGTMYEFLDEDLNVIGTFGMDDFEALQSGPQAA